MKLYDANCIKWYDKINPRFLNFSEEGFKKGGFRIVPGAFVRNGAYIGKNAVVMPSFINIGAHIGDGTMIDSWATVGSCAYIGKNCHISSGVGVGDPPFLFLPFSRFLCLTFSLVVPRLCEPLRFEGVHTLQYGGIRTLKLVDLSSVCPKCCNSLRT